LVNNFPVDCKLQVHIHRLLNLTAEELQQDCGSDFHNASGGGSGVCIIGLSKAGILDGAESIKKSVAVTIGVAGTQFWFPLYGRSFPSSKMDDAL
jgi:hypothetical protein